MTKRQANIYKAIKDGYCSAREYAMNSSKEQLKEEFRYQFYLSSINELKTISELSYMFHLFNEVCEIEPSEYERVNMLSLDFSDLGS